MRKTYLRSGLFLFALFIFAAKSFAGDNDSLKAQMIRDWQRAKDYTKAYLDKMPADKYSYRPVDSIRSFAEQMLHLAQANVFLLSAGTSKDPVLMTRQLEKVASAKTKDSVMYFVMASYDYCINSVKEMDPSKFSEVIKMGDLSATRLTWAMKAFEHQTHHRGQTTIYIRLQGIVPPGEMLF
jgi:uncharacterized damage-inducible protein DinB